MRLRHSARALLLTPDNRILLCRHALPGGGGVWAPPGGGIEPGETPLDALRRELREELGLSLDVPAPHVWQRRNVGADYVPGFGGVVNDYFLVRTTEFTTTGHVPAEDLRWWSLAEMIAYDGPDLFGPRDLASRLSATLVG